MVATNTISEKGDGAEALLKNTKAGNISVAIATVGTIRAQLSRCVLVCIFIVLLLCTVTLVVGFWLKSERQLPLFCCSCDKLKETPGTVVHKGKSTCCINTESQYIQAMKHIHTANNISSSPKTTQQSRQKYDRYGSFRCPFVQNDLLYLKEKHNREEYRKRRQDRGEGVSCKGKGKRIKMTTVISSKFQMLNKPEPKPKPENSEDPKAFVTEKEMKMLVAKNETITLLHSSPVAAHVLVACTNSSYYPYPPKVQDLPPTRILELLPRRSLSLLRGVELSRDHLIIQTKGLYLIYSQIYFKVIQGTNWPLGLNLLCHIVERYNRRIQNDGIEKLLQSTHTLPKRVHPRNTMFDFHTSYISGVVELEVNDEVFVRASLE